jgi:hypothetical protein
MADEIKRLAVLDVDGNIVNLIVASDEFAAHLASQGIETADVGVEPITMGDRYDEMSGFEITVKPPPESFPWRTHDVLETERARILAFGKIATIDGTVAVDAADLGDLITAAQAGK